MVDSRRIFFQKSAGLQFVFWLRCAQLFRPFRGSVDVDEFRRAQKTFPSNLPMIASKQTGPTRDRPARGSGVFQSVQFVPAKLFFFFFFFQLGPRAPTSGVLPLSKRAPRAFRGDHPWPGPFRPPDRVKAFPARRSNFFFKIFSSAQRQNHVRPRAAEFRILRSFE